MPLSEERIRQFDEVLGQSSSPVLSPERIKQFDDILASGVVHQPKNTYIEQLKGIPKTLGDAYSARDKEIEQSAMAQAAGEQSAASTMFQNAMSNASKFTDTLAVPISAYIPDDIENAIGGFINKGVQFAGRLPSAGGGTIGEAIPKELERNPELARNLKAGGQALNLVGAAIPATKLAPSVSRGAGGVIESAGGAIRKSGQVVIDNRKNDFLLELITPKQTPTVKGELFAKSKEKGILRERVVEPAVFDLEIMNDVGSTGVKSGNSLVKNYNIINEAISKEAQALRDALIKNDKILDKNVIDGAFAKVRQDIESSPYLTTDSAVKSADRVIAGAMESLKKNPPTAAGVLQARKDFDAWVEKYKRNAFDPTTDSPVTDTVAKVRAAMNDVIAQSVPDANVKQSLRKQSNLYRAKEAIETKGGYEPKNALARVTEKVTDSIPGKTFLAKSALTTAGLGGATFYPAITLGVAGLYGAGKLATSPTLRKMVGAGIEKTGQALKYAGGEKPRLSAPIAPIPATSPPPSPMLALPAPGKATPIPMSESEIALAQARLNRGNKNTVTQDGAAIRVNPTPEQLPTKLLEGPKEYAVTPQGQPRLKTGQELEGSYAARERAKILGLTPDVRRNLFRNQMKEKFGPIWNKIDAENQAKIADEIEAAWKSQQIPLVDIIDQAKRNFDDLLSAKGEPVVDNAMSEAFMKAKTLKEISQMPPKQAQEYLKQMRKK